MAPKLKISRYLIDKLDSVKEESLAGLYGIMYSGNLLVVGLKSFENTNYPSVPYSFVTEVDLCGVIAFGNEDINSDSINNLLKEVDITDNPLILNCPLGKSSTLTAYFCIHDRLEKTTFEIMSDTEMWKQFVHVRLKTQVPLICEWNADSITSACNTLHKKFVNGQVSFHFPKAGVFLMGTDAEAGLTGITGEPLVGELCDFSAEQSEGGSMKSRKKQVTQIDILDVAMFWKPTHDSLNDSTKHAPIINHNIKSYNCLVMHLKIDTLSMLYRQTKVINMYNILIESLCRCLKLNEQCLLNQVATMVLDSNQKQYKVNLPIPYHFMPNECGHFITVLYDKNVREDDLITDRKLLHQLCFLPVNRPYFRRTNAFIFEEDYPRDGKLINPHEGIQSTVKDGETYLVRGKYTYYHYLQDGFDDDGWGCAYRSLQTLCSWFRWQGFTNRPVPTHKEIQECLVRIGDKPASFINSKQWIGSTEVSFCLETMLGVQSRILTVNSGAEIATLGPQLVRHFQTQGTPIMIGGGVLAHTIVGVDYNKWSDEIKFLILDPHFKGADDLHQVQNKGGCAWKTVDFWKKGAYYNLCLPLVPNSV